MSIKAKGMQFASQALGWTPQGGLADAAVSFMTNYRPQATHSGAAYGVGVGSSGTGLSGGQYDAKYDMGLTGKGPRWGTDIRQPQVEKPSPGDIDAINTNLQQWQATSARSQGMWLPESVPGGDDIELSPRMQSFVRSAAKRSPRFRQAFGLNGEGPGQPQQLEMPF